MRRKRAAAGAAVQDAADAVPAHQRDLTDESLRNKGGKI